MNTYNFTAGMHLIFGDSGDIELLILMNSCDVLLLLRVRSADLFWEGQFLPIQKLNRIPFISDDKYLMAVVKLNARLELGLAETEEPAGATMPRISIYRRTRVLLDLGIAVFLGERARGGLMDDRCVIKVLKAVHLISKLSVSKFRAGKKRRAVCSFKSWVSYISAPSDLLHAVCHPHTQFMKIHLIQCVQRCCLD